MESSSKVVPLKVVVPLSNQTSVEEEPTETNIELLSKVVPLSKQTSVEEEPTETNMESPCEVVPLSRQTSVEEEPAETNMNSSFKVTRLTRETSEGEQQKAITRSRTAAPLQAWQLLDVQQDNPLDNQQAETLDDHQDVGKKLNTPTRARTVPSAWQAADDNQLVKKELKQVDSEKKEKEEEEKKQKEQEIMIERVESVVRPIRQSVKYLLKAGIVFLIFLVLVSLGILFYYLALLNSFPPNGINEALKKYVTEVNGTKGWDINKMGGYPILIDGWNPVWVNRTVSNLSKVGDVTWRYDSTCSKSMIAHAEKRGVSIADAMPRPVPCEGNASLRCAYIPFHFHLHGSYTEHRYWEDGTNLTYRGLFHHDFISRYVSSILTTNPVAGASGKVHFDYEGTAPELNFPDQPKFEGYFDFGVCVDANSLMPEWAQSSGGFDLPKAMKRPMNMLLYTNLASVTNSYTHAGNDRVRKQAILDEAAKINAKGQASAYIRDKWDRRCTEAKHVPPSESAFAMIKCLHFNGDHPETRTHPQRCIKHPPHGPDGKEVVVAEEFGEIGKKNWVITNKDMFESQCSKFRKDPSECGHPCGYMVVPLGQEIMTLNGFGQFDEEGPEGRAVDFYIGTSVVDFEGDQLVIYLEASSIYTKREKTWPTGPPSYLMGLRVAPNTWGGPPQTKFDGRGMYPGLAVFPYEYAQKESLMRNLHVLYHNLYKEENGFLLGGGCGMPDYTTYWGEGKQECKDDSSIKKSYATLREVSAHEYTDQRHMGRTPKWNDKFDTAYAFVRTLECAGTFQRMNRVNSHGIDWFEAQSWGHQLMEYAPDLELHDMIRRKYWNNRDPVNETCPAE